MSQPFNIQNDTVVITKLNVSEITEPVTVSGDLTASVITVETLNVRNLIRNGNNSAEIGAWASNTEDQLNGKGFSWAWGNGGTNLQYRTGGNLWTNGNFDLDPDKSFKIGGTSILSKNELGAQVTKSRLREVGVLRTLEVTGEASIGEFVHFKSNFQRVGINTETPNGALSVVANDIEIVMGSQQIGKAYVGTYTNHDLVLGADNTARITIKSNGEVIVGDEQARSSVVRIYGELIVEKLTTDTRTDTISPVHFNATRSSPIYGLGLIWTGGGADRKLIMQDGPDRLWTTESFDLGEDKAYHINGTLVLSTASLGASVVNSNLNKVGTLQDLTVSGKTMLLGDVEATAGRLLAKTITFNDGSQQVSMDNYKINTSNQFSIRVRDQEAFYADSTEIALGNSSNPRRLVKVFGSLSVGANNPDPRVSLAVNGNASFAGRMFSSGSSAPINGISNVGDVVWNDTPQSGNYIGWVCTIAGEPGTWMPFGAIGHQ
jgi:hypothetical protein